MKEWNVEVYQNIIKSLELSKEFDDSAARTLNEFKVALLKEHTEASKYDELNALYDILDVQSKLGEYLIKGIEKLAEIYDNDVYDNMHPKTRQDILWSMHELNLLAKIPLLYKLIAVDKAEKCFSLVDIVQYAIGIEIDEDVVKAVLQESYEKYGAIDYTEILYEDVIPPVVMSVLKLESKLDNIEEPIFELIGDLGKEIANHIIDISNRNTVEELLHVVEIEHSVLESHFLEDDVLPGSTYDDIVDNLEAAIKEFKKKIIK